MYGREVAPQFFNPEGKENNVPLVDGICVPMPCYTRRLVQVGAVVFQRITRSDNPVRQVTDVTNQPVAAGMLQKGLNQLNAGADAKCDDCVCYGVRFNPPLRTDASTLVDSSSDTDQQGVTTTYEYFVCTVWDWLSIGNCVPPGSEFHIGGKLVPVEKAPWPVVKPGRSESGGGEGSPGKKPKKKRPAVKRAVKKPVAKKKAAKKAKTKKSVKRRR